MKNYLKNKTILVQSAGKSRGRNLSALTIATKKWLSGGYCAIAVMVALAYWATASKDLNQLFATWKSRNQSEETKKFIAELL